MNTINLQDLAYRSILDLVSEDGINASGREEVFGCLFGRDAAISVLQILKAVPRYVGSTVVDANILLEISRQTLSSLAALQGQEANLESGEEPGKFVHEYRKDNYDRLLTAFERPWYVYPDGKIRNYDSLDSTPLTLIAFYRYWKVSRDNAFIEAHLPIIEKALTWLVTYGDKDNDGLLEYELSNDRVHGGLCVQSWTDSTESLLQADGSFPRYPIAPVEVQGYAWLALKLWADYFQSEGLRAQANRIKQTFNDKFILSDNGKYYAAQALDGNKNQIKTITGNPLLLLWASYTKDGQTESVIKDEFIADFVDRAFMPDMFDAHAGIRTMSTLSPTYNPNQDSYHNGSFWPKLNGMAHSGLSAWDFKQQAELLREATIAPIRHFQTPVELYMKNNDGTYLEYKNASGQAGCRNQAWSAAVLLDLSY